MILLEDLQGCRDFQSFVFKVFTDFFIVFYKMFYEHERKISIFWSLLSLWTSSVNYKNKESSNLLQGVLCLINMFLTPFKTNINLFQVSHFENPWTSFESHVSYTFPFSIFLVAQHLVWFGYKVSIYINNEKALKLSNPFVSEYPTTVFPFGSYVNPLIFLSK